LPLYGRGNIVYENVLGVNIILKGEEVYAIFGGVETKVPTSLASYTWVNRCQSTPPVQFGWII
jgi:hypothetical protein